MCQNVRVNFFMIQEKFTCHKTSLPFSATCHLLCHLPSANPFSFQPSSTSHHQLAIIKLLFLMCQNVRVNFLWFRKTLLATKLLFFFQPSVIFSAILSSLWFSHQPPSSASFNSSPDPNHHQLGSFFMIQEKFTCHPTSLSLSAICHLLICHQTFWNSSSLPANPSVLFSSETLLPSVLLVLLCQRILLSFCSEILSSFIPAICHQTFRNSSFVIHSFVKSLVHLRFAELNCSQTHNIFSTLSSE